MSAESETNKFTITKTPYELTRLAICSRNAFNAVLFGFFRQKRTPWQIIGIVLAFLRIK